MFLDAPRRLLWHGLTNAPRGEHLSTRSRLFVDPLSTSPSASRNTFSVSTITDGNDRAGSRSSHLPLRKPDCTWSRLCAEEYDRPIARLRSFNNQCIRVLRDATQLWYNFHDSHRVLVVAFSSFAGMVAFLLAFCLVVHQTHDAGTNTCLQPYKPFHLDTIDTREDANIHKAIACKYLSNNFCTVVEELHHGYFCLKYFFSSTHSDLVKGLARKAWRQCV